MKTLLTAEDIAALPEHRHQHQFNDNAVRLTRSIGDLAGLSRCGVHLVRIEAGHDSTRYHRHQYSDEWVYILAGRGIATIDGEEHAVGPGDFMGFPAKGPAHGMHNPGPEDLVYLMGGSRPEVDVADYPEIARRIYLMGEHKEYVEHADLHTVPRPSE